MAENINALCYSNGTIIKGPNGVDYEGSITKVVTISPIMSFNELVDQICIKLKIDRNRYTIKIIYRYTRVFSQSNLVFSAIEIVDDEDLGLLFGMVMSL